MKSRGEDRPSAEVSLRLCFGDSAPVWDQRAVALLEQIEAHGSITKAAKAVGISYRTAWLLASKLRSHHDESVLVATAQGTYLTAAGQSLVRQFRRTEHELETVLGRINRSLWSKR